MNAAELDPNQCIAHLNGYFLWKVDDKPIVVRKWTSRKKDDTGQFVSIKNERRMDLRPANSEDGDDAKDALDFLNATWNDYIGWCEAMKS